MTAPVEPKVPDVAPTAGRSTRPRWPLIGAIGLTVVAALILVHELSAIRNEPAVAPAVTTSDAGAAPVPLSSQPFAFGDQPVAVPDLKFVDGGEQIGRASCRERV